MTSSGYTRRSLGSRLATALDERAARGDLEWSTEVDQLGRLVYIVAPGRAWAEPRPAALLPVADLVGKVGRGEFAVDQKKTS